MGQVDYVLADLHDREKSMRIRIAILQFIDSLPKDWKCRMIYVRQKQRRPVAIMASISFLSKGTST